MCGIFGIFNASGAPVDLQLVQRGTMALRHRGPDNEGYLLANTRRQTTELCSGVDTQPQNRWPRIESKVHEHFDLALGFRRLSIIDLSPAGCQPMPSIDGRYWIVFNGEIYNYLELRAELESLGHQFRTRTDIEVILAAYAHWGVDCLQRLNGMWAFAIWDASDRKLFLARDRFGEKPLHYVYVPGKLFAFASEIKALHSAEVVAPRVHEETLLRYQHYDQTDVTEQTFYEGVLRLPQAHFMIVDDAGHVFKQRYWDIDPSAQEPRESESSYADRFRELFFDSVKLRLRADVPVGSSLSGGIDSSSVVAVMDRLLPEGAVQKTFSARFDDQQKDEGKWIDQVIDVTHVEPHAVWPKGEGMFAELDRIFYHQEEPFSSASIYAQWCVMRLAKEHHVTVLLDGQGADEMLAGYHLYFGAISEDLLKSARVPALISLRHDYRALHGRPIEPLSTTLRRGIPRAVKQPLKGLMKRNGNGVEPVVPEFPREFSKVSELRKALWWHTTRQGLVELLRYADRNSMAHSREVRLPFLDHRLVEFVFTIPDNFVVRNGWTKWILRQALRGIVPEAILARVDKLGYEPPQAAWLGTLSWKDLMLNQLNGRGGSLAQIN